MRAVRIGAAALVVAAGGLILGAPAVRAVASCGSTSTITANPDRTSTVVGDPVHFTITVNRLSGGFGVWGGTIDVYEDGTLIDAGALTVLPANSGQDNLWPDSAQGQSAAVYTLNFTSPGTHTVKFYYSNTTNCPSSSFIYVPINVGPAPTPTPTPQPTPTPTPKPTLPPLPTPTLPPKPTPTATPKPTATATPTAAPTATPGPTATPSPTAVATPLPSGGTGGPPPGAAPSSLLTGAGHLGGSDVPLVGALPPSTLSAALLDIARVPPTAPLGGITAPSFGSPLIIWPVLLLIIVLAIFGIVTAGRKWAGDSLETQDNDDPGFPRPTLNPLPQGA